VTLVASGPGEVLAGSVDGALNGQMGRAYGGTDGTDGTDGTETVDAWDCVDGCPVAELDAQSGDRRSGGTLTGAEPWSCGFSGPVYGSGMTPRAWERPTVAGVSHPTVKPLGIMTWLVRLVTQPGGLVVDPFGGSGTTAEACLLEGLRCEIIERDAAYIPLIEARLAKYDDPVVWARARRGERVPSRPSKTAAATVTDDDLFSAFGEPA
jgi:hypothetical protein